MIVLSRGAAVPHEGVITTHSIDAAFAEAARIEQARGDAAEIFVGGGAQIFELALPRIERIYLTRVHGEVYGETRVSFLDMGTGPGLPEGFVAAAEPEPLDEHGATHRATFHVYERAHA
jgi:dihydrofolate reductase